MLTLLITLPLLGALLILRRSDHEAEAIRLEAAIWSGLVAVLSSLMYWQAARTTGGAANQFAFEIDAPLFARFGIRYHLGIDGVSGLLVMLTGVLGFISVLSSWTSVQERVKGFMVALLALESAVIGVFSALDLFVFYIFWEAVLIPMYFLIGIWGGERRIYAAIKFFLYTLVGSLLMLVAFLWLAYSGPERSFDLLQLYQRDIPVGQQLLPFLAVALAFAIKVPLFPLHTWLPDAHVEAPTAGSIMLAGVLLKMGTYGFIRIALPLFPVAAAQAAPWIIALAVIGIIYGALVALAQPDVKKLVAYSSVAHLGFVMLGLFTFTLAGLQGGMIQQINHGVSTGALFLMVGMIYERRHSRQISDFGGLWSQMPLFSRLFLVTMLASVGLPGLNGFVGEFLVLLGASERSIGLAVAAGIGVILAASYLLWMFQRVVYGPAESPEVRKLTDLNQRELWCIVPLAVLMFWLGLFPTAFLKPAEPTMRWLAQRVELGGQPAATRGATATAGAVEGLNR
ncbi:MAG: NADH-quinone oxidoreductase subunit M [Armatimonadetes bacterium]|nr:NADH-quinone oxidoreductase subunit M [Armatimonadota bacterium]